MKIVTTLLVGAALLLPHAAASQESDITRRTFRFLDDRLVVTVVGEAPGQLNVLRGEPGRLEVAGRSTDGFTGFGLGGTLTRELRLTAIGAEHVRFLVVVPERVRVTLRLPDGHTATLSTLSAAGAYRWGAIAGTAGEDTLDLAPTTQGGLYVVHATPWAPSVVDVPDLTAIRSLSLRFEGSEFRVAASRPLAVTRGHSGRLEIRVTGEPLDLVLYVPRGRNHFLLRSGSVRLAEAFGGRARALCGNVALHRPTPAQEWLTFHPQDGRLDCL